MDDPGSHCSVFSYTFIRRRRVSGSLQVGGVKMHPVAVI